MSAQRLLKSISKTMEQYINKLKETSFEVKKIDFSFFHGLAGPQIPDPQVNAVLGICQDNNEVALSMNDQYRVRDFAHNIQDIGRLLGGTVVQLVHLDLGGVCVLTDDCGEHIVSDDVRAKNLVACCIVDRRLGFILHLVNDRRTNDAPQTSQTVVSVFVPVFRNPDVGAVTFVFKLCYSEILLAY